MGATHMSGDQLSSQIKPEEWREAEIDSWGGPGFPRGSGFVRLVGELRGCGTGLSLMVVGTRFFFGT